MQHGLWTLLNFVGISDCQKFRQNNVYNIVPWTKIIYSAIFMSLGVLLLHRASVHVSTEAARHRPEQLDPGGPEPQGDP